MNHNLIRQIEQNLGLIYTNETSPNNLCFATDNDSLRDEFKITFTSEDLRSFLKARTGEEMPESVGTFWKMVKKGQELN